MKKVQFLLLLTVVLLAGFLGIDYFQSYYFVIPLESLNSYNIPSSYVEIEGKPYLLEIDLGAKSALSLHKDILNHIDKTPCGKSRRKDFLGNTYTTNAYLIPKVKIANQTLKKIKAKEESPEFAANSVITKPNTAPSLGRVGRDFFEGKNLFLDFSRGLIIVCSHLKDIEREGYDPTRACPVPFQNSPAGIIFKIETDMGTKNFALDTGSTKSTIRAKSNTKKTDGLKFVKTTLFATPNKDFGPQNLLELNISESFDEIDGLLGMDFLEKTPVFLDQKKQLAYFMPSNEQ